MDREYIIRLYDIYKELLTSKQQEYFTYYYFEDLSFSEIAENMNVSKALVSKTLNNIIDKLEVLDSKLGLYNLYNEIENIKDDSIREKLVNLIK